MKRNSTQNKTQRAKKTSETPRKATRQDAYAAFKSEISRIARKEVRGEMESLKKQSTHFRSQIATLKRQVASTLRKQLKSAKSVLAPPTDHEGARAGLRFRSKGFAAHRKRLGLSAAQAGALLGDFRPALAAGLSKVMRTAQHAQPRIGGDRHFDRNSFVGLGSAR